MGKKYSINSAGKIVAERDIYSLGGFIPKGIVGGSVKDETQLSQEGECWLAGGDISTRPDVRLKDNAYIGDFFTNESPVHTDGIMEFSGNTLIPGHITVRCPQADPKNNVFIKDSFIGVSMDVLCGPATTTTAFPFEQGDFKKEVAKGTLFTSASMRLDDVSACRNTATLRLGRNTYLYIPTGYRARVFWAYYGTSGQLTYSGESTAVAAGLTKLDHSVYKLAMVSVVKNDGTAMTPANLLATGAKILGHISGSLLQDFRPESVSGEYAIVNSSFIAETDNFGLNITQLRFLAGGLYNANMYTLTNRQDYKPYGTFRNVERLEYTKYLSDYWRTNVNRDTCISGYDCPLLRVDDNTYDTNIINAGGVTLRRCIVPKGRFALDTINGNTYEDIDFSYTKEFMGAPAGNRTLVCSHKQGLYGLYAASGVLTGLVSYPDNTKNATSITEKHANILLDGDLIEQGAYTTAPGKYYENSKIADPNRVRMAKPIATLGIGFPSLPTGFSVKAVHYLDDGFILRSTVLDPSTIEQTHPYVVMTFRHNDDSAITASEFIALNVSLIQSDYTKTPEITGSAYVGAGCTVRGDVQLQGDPYVNRVFDVNMWERGTTQDGDLPNYPTWEDRKIPTTVGNRFRFIDAFEVEPGGTFSCAEGYLIHLYRFDGSGKWIGQAGWATSQYIPEGETRFAGLIIKKTTNASDAGGLITEEDLALANVKYLRAFKKRRYIVNELDRVSPEDILLGPDMWEQGYLDRLVGKTYEELKSTSGLFVRLKRPVNTGMGAVSSFSGRYDRKDVSFDAATKCVTADSTIVDGTPLYGATIYKVPSAAISVADVAGSRFKVEFTPSPRIVVPYGASGVFITGMKIRMYDNSVLSKNISTPEELILKGDAVVSHIPGGCVCGWGDSDAIVKF